MGVRESGDGQTKKSSGRLLLLLIFSFFAMTMAPPEDAAVDDAIKSIRGGYIVSKLPPDVSSASIADAMQKAATSTAQSASNSSTPPPSSFDIHVDFRPNPADPIASYAFVTPLWLREDNYPPWAEHLEQSLLADGLNINDAKCRVKKRRAPKRDRIAQNEHSKERKRRAVERAQAKRPRWQPELLDKFDARDHSLDPHAFVADLDEERLHLIEDVYLPYLFPKSCRAEVIGALKHVWTTHPKSLRVKEMFETLEAFRLIEKQISLLMARRREERKEENQVTTIYDLACGHGLLGVVLAYRFADVRVVCVDMERRNCFDHYIEGFTLHGKAAKGEDHPLSNLEFLEQDFTTLRAEDIGGASSFITMIHGCNEATKLAIEMAQKHGAGYAFMPCCIRDGLYGSVTRVAQVDDATRHTVMVGIVAGQYGAHLISAIDQRITNRNLILFGGYSLHDDVSTSKKEDLIASGGKVPLHHKHIA